MAANHCDIADCERCDRNRDLARRDICMCLWLDLDKGVRTDNTCTTCGKLVVMLRLNLFMPLTKCKCEDATENTFYFCDKCRGVVYMDNGFMHELTKISVDRALQLGDKIAQRKNNLKK
jgi:hypothetical protein